MRYKLIATRPDGQRIGALKGRIYEGKLAVINIPDGYEITRDEAQQIAKSVQGSGISEGILFVPEGTVMELLEVVEVN